MINFGVLTIAEPLLLTALLALPMLWWLLRVTPPAPKKIKFPAIRFLAGLADETQTPQHTPPWLLILRLIICGLIIIGLSDPFVTRSTEFKGSGPLAIVIDNGWASAQDWNSYTRQAEIVIDQANRAGRPLILLPTAPNAKADTDLSLLTPIEARAKLKLLRPVPWNTNREPVATRLNTFVAANSQRIGPPEIVWISDGLDSGAIKPFARSLATLGPTWYMPITDDGSLLVLSPPVLKEGNFEIAVKRQSEGRAFTGQIDIRAQNERLLQSAPFTFGETDLSATTNMSLPLELRNEAATVKIAGQQSAATIVLLDERWRRRKVGIIAGGSNERERPLLSDAYYLKRALEPIAEASTGSPLSLLEDNPSILILPDIGQVITSEQSKVFDWIDNGGLLVRFAGPRLSAQSDRLLPVPLRSGSRALGSVLSWDTPQSLADFSEGSPFYGLSIPNDVTVSRQILADPSTIGDGRTWAHLTDGTPLVTAAPHGNGWIVLFHVPASPEWSSLPLSGLFVEMFERIVAFSVVAETTSLQDFAGEHLAALKSLDGFGVLGQPLASISPLSVEDIKSWTPNQKAPPGLYGSPSNALALNLSEGLAALVPIEDLPAGITLMAADGERSFNVKPWALSAAFILLLIDGLALLFLTDALSRLTQRNFLSRSTTAPALAIAVICLQIFTTDANAADDTLALEATSEIHLAYVKTGDTKIDTMSHAGLFGLGQELIRRTAVEPGAPIGLDLETSELAFYPLIYWPITEHQTELNPIILRKIDRYLKSGGTILFDTQDFQRQLPQAFANRPSTPNEAKLRLVMSELDIPHLEQVPASHVLTKSFYLLQDFPGRWTGGAVWVEVETNESGGKESLANDGVSTVIIGSNDWPAAWAKDRDGNPLAPVSPGGTRQREMAYRFGVNLVMYTLTGNYKADQVHVPALLERLGQ